MPGNNTSFNKEIAFNFVMKVQEKQKKMTTFLAAPISTISAVCRSADKLQKISLQDLNKENKQIFGNMKFVGIDERYFISALIPKENSQFYDCRFIKVEKDKNKNFINVCIY